MFYGAFVLAKKGPLAKVWLAAHWDKKLTKAHVFETDVETTVDNIISPQVKMALRTSGHLLLGVVRIYSRKQKYLIHDLGEACAKIKMAFRPGIVDLPSEGGVDNPEAITLPEIFHDFETAVADLGSLDLDAQFTINPSRAAEITIADDFATTGGDMFGGEFGEFDLGGGEFGGGMEDIEVPRNTRSIGFGEDKDLANENDLQVSDANGTTLLDGSTKGPRDFTMEDRQLDAMHDFGGGGDFLDGFGDGDQGMVDLEDLPGMADIPALEEEPSATDKGITVPDADKDKETPMDVDQQPEPPQPQDGDQTLVEGETTTTSVVPEEDEGGFVLEPVDMTGMEEKKVKRKRRLVVDSDKEFTGLQIRSQFQDFKDLLQPKCFPPPTKKALLWKEMAGCEQLFSNPTTPLFILELSSLVKRNYTTEIPGEPDAGKIIDLEPEPVNVDATKDLNATEDTTIDIEKNRAAGGEAGADLTVGETTVPEGEITDQGPAGVDATMGGFDFDMGPDDMRPIDFEGDFGGPFNGEQLDEGDEVSRVIPDLPEIDDISATQSTEEQQSNELSEEFEQRRWTKRTQQVLRVLDRNLANTDSVKFSSLTQKCTRKQAASRFYTCLLLAKEGMVDVEQSEPYAEIVIHKGPKFTEVL